MAESLLMNLFQDQDIASFNQYMNFRLETFQVFGTTVSIASHGAGIWIIHSLMNLSYGGDFTRYRSVRLYNGTVLAGTVEYLYEFGAAASSSGEAHQWIFMIAFEENSSGGKFKAKGYYQNDMVVAGMTTSQRWRSLPEMMYLTLLASILTNKLQKRKTSLGKFP